MIPRPPRSTRTDPLLPDTTRVRSIFTAGSPTAPRMYDEAAQLVQDYGLDACPHHIADRAAFRHAAAEGKTAMEIEPSGKAADEVRQLYKWTCEHVNMQASRKRRANA